MYTYFSLYSREHSLLVMLRPVLSVQLATIVQQLTPFSYLVRMGATPLDHKMPVLHALQASPAHQPQQLQLLLIFACQVVTVLVDNSHVLCALRGLLVRRHVLMISSCVEKGLMLLAGLMHVSPVKQVNIVRTQPPIPYSALRATTV